VFCIQLVPKSYTKKRKGERTSIAIDPLLTKRINKILKNREKLAEFAREAISEKLWDREREVITSLSATEQFHKIETMKKDIEELKWDLDHLGSKLNGFKDMDRRLDKLDKKRDSDYREGNKRIQGFMKDTEEVIKILKFAKKNPIVRKELEKL